MIKIIMGRENMEGKGKGYIGKKMSVNAANAYIEGEKPISKWTKTAIFEEIENSCDEISQEKVEILKKLTLSELRKNFLRYTVYHHTGKFYNSTNFYRLDVDWVENITVEEIKKIIDERKKPVRRPQAVIDAEKAEKEKRRAEKAEKEEKENLFKYQTKYKSLGGFMRSKTVDLDALRKIRKEKIGERREQLRKSWKNQNFSYGLKNIENDEFIEKYIK